MVGALAASRGIRSASAQQPAMPALFMDGHVHITNRVYWEKTDFWQKQPGHWDYARARAGGINCIVDNLGTYGGWNYNYTPKIFLRLIETAWRTAERHKDRMAIVTTTAQARQAIGSGRMGGVPRQRIGLGPRGRPLRARRLLPARPALDPVRHPDRFQRLRRFAIASGSPSTRTR